MNQCPGCCHTHADEELTYCLDEGANLSARCDDKITEQMSQPNNSISLPLKAASPQKRWIILGSVVAALITLMSGYGAHGAGKTELANQNSLPASASPDPGITSSPTITSASQAPVVNSADDDWPLPPVAAGNRVALDKQAAQDL